MIKRKLEEHRSIANTLNTDADDLMPGQEGGIDTYRFSVLETKHNTVMPTREYLAAAAVIHSHRRILGLTHGCSQDETLARRARRMMCTERETKQMNPAGEGMRGVCVGEQCTRPGWRHFGSTVGQVRHFQFSMVRGHSKKKQGKVEAAGAST